MSPNHPVRLIWERFLNKSGISVNRDLYHYINGGFVGLKKSRIEFLYIWQTIMNAGYNDPDIFLEPKQFKHSLNRSNEFFAQDQDGLNMALMCCESKVCDYGPEGMDFLGGGRVMSHSTGSPKPWKINFVMHIIKGIPISLASHFYWHFIGSGPIFVFSDKELKLKKLLLKINKFSSRFYSKK